MQELIPPLKPATQLPSYQASNRFRAENKVTAIAWARARDSTGWKLVLSFADRDGRNHQLQVRRSEIVRGDLLFELLDHHGFAVPTDVYSRAALRRSVLAADPEQRLLIADRGKLISEAGPHEAVQTALAKIIDRLPSLAKHAIDISKRKHREDAKAAASAAVLRIRDTNGERLLAVLPSTLKKIIGPAVPEKLVAAELEKRGVLIPRGKGRRTRELRLPGGNVRRSYYCLRLPGRRETA